MKILNESCGNFHVKIDFWMKIDVILITSWILLQVEQFLSVEPLTKVFKIWKSWWKYDDDTFKWSKKPQVKRVAHKKLGSRWTWQNVINETNSYNRSQYTKTYCRYVAQNVAVSLVVLCCYLHKNQQKTIAKPLQ